MARKLALLVEGPSDVRFAESIIVPIASRRYDSVKVIAYSGLPTARLNHLIRGLRATGCEYIFMHDFDQGQCIRTRIESTLKLSAELEEDRVVIVREEIESWYLAGVDSIFCLKSGVRWNAVTDGVTKERFRQCMPKAFGSYVDFMIELLKVYSMVEARRRNSSIDYLFSRSRFGLF
jgi:hypothetical protein